MVDFDRREQPSPTSEAARYNCAVTHVHNDGDDNDKDENRYAAEIVWCAVSRMSAESRSCSGLRRADAEVQLIARSSHSLHAAVVGRDKSIRYHRLSCNPAALAAAGSQFVKGVAVSRRAARRDRR